MNNSPSYPLSDVYLKSLLVVGEAVRDPELAIMIAAGLCPAAITVGLLQKVLREQLEDRLVRLVGDGQRRDFQLLPRLQGQQVGAFLVLVGQHEVAGARLQGVDHVLLERLTGLDRRGVRAERLGLRTYSRDRSIDRCFRRRDIGVIQEPSAGGRRQAETLGVELHAGDGQRAGAVLVEQNL